MDKSQSSSRSEPQSHDTNQESSSDLSNLEPDVRERVIIANFLDETLEIFDKSELSSKSSYKGLRSRVNGRSGPRGNSLVPSVSLVLPSVLDTGSGAIHWNNIEIPVEVSDSWYTISVQLAKYACAMFTNDKTRRFVVALGFQHESKEVRIYAYHPGGVTTTDVMNPTDPDEHRQFVEDLMQFLALLPDKHAGLVHPDMWKSKEAERIGYEELLNQKSQMYAIFAPKILGEPTYRDRFRRVAFAVSGKFGVMKIWAHQTLGDNSYLLKNAKPLNLFDDPTNPSQPELRQHVRIYALNGSRQLHETESPYELLETVLHGVIGHYVTLRETGFLHGDMGKHNFLRTDCDYELTDAVKQLFLDIGLPVPPKCRGIIVASDVPTKLGDEPGRDRTTPSCVWAVAVSALGHVMTDDVEEPIEDRDESQDSAKNENANVEDTEQVKKDANVENENAGTSGEVRVEKDELMEKGGAHNEKKSANEEKDETPTNKDENAVEPDSTKTSEDNNDDSSAATLTPTATTPETTPENKYTDRQNEMYADLTSEDIGAIRAARYDLLGIAQGHPLLGLLHAWADYLNKARRADHSRTVPMDVLRYHFVYLEFLRIGFKWLEKRKGRLGKKWEVFFEEYPLPRLGGT